MDKTMKIKTILVLVFITHAIVQGFRVNRNRSDDLFTFIAIGDWGGQPDSPYTTPIEVNVAHEMSQIAGKTKAKFVLALGDNFYEDGVRDVNDKRFTETFEDVFSSPYLKVPWYIIAGNHDHHRNVSAQIAYTQKSTRWIYPDFFYSKTFTIGDVEMEIVMIDTVILCGNSGHDDHGRQPNGPDDILTSEAQWSWIEKTIAASKSDYLFVAGHYPVWSAGHHGPTDCLVERLRPLLMKYKVTAYLCGHDHNLQHLKEDGSPVEYILTGAANKANTEKSHGHTLPNNALKYFWASEDKSGGFAVFTAQQGDMKMEFLTGKGDVLYNLKFNPRSF